MPLAIILTLTLLVLALVTGAAGAFLVAGAGWTLLFLAACFAGLAYVLTRGASANG